MKPIRNWRRRLRPMPAAPSSGWRSRGQGSPRAARLLGTASRSHHRAGRWPGRIGKGAARTGCLARWAAGCASVRVGCCSGRARGLRLKNGEVTGIDAHRDGADLAVDARAVVIADGGFPGNAELFRRYIGPRPDRVLMRHAGTAIGDGLKMAAEAGAALIGLDRFYGHLMSRDAMENTALWPYPQIDAVATAGIVVDRDGGRFLDEGLGGIAIANELARLDDQLCATVICDAPIWETAGSSAQIPPNPQLPAAGGTVHQAGTIEALGRLAGLPGDSLAATVAEYNDAVRPIDTPPFFAIPICAGITNTFGGIAIDGHGRVKRPDGSPITGLYAAGGSTGGLEGGSALGYVGGLIKACVFGLLVAEHAAGR